MNSFRDLACCDLNRFCSPPLMVGLGQVLIPVPRSVFCRFFFAFALAAVCNIAAFWTPFIRRCVLKLCLCSCWCYYLCSFFVRKVLVQGVFSFDLDENQKISEKGKIRVWSELLTKDLLYRRMHGFLRL